MEWYQKEDQIVNVLMCWWLKYSLYLIVMYKNKVIKDIHNSWLYCFTNPLELGTRVSLSHRQPNVLVADDAKAKHVSQVQED